MLICSLLLGIKCRPLENACVLENLARFAARGYAYDLNSRTKPHLNIGTIGHVDHGKTTLTAAITKACFCHEGPFPRP